MANISNISNLAIDNMVDAKFNAITPKIEKCFEIVDDGYIKLLNELINLNIKSDQLNGKFDEVDAKIDNLQHKSEEMDAKFDKMDVKIDHVHADLSTKIDNLHADLNTKIDNLHADLNTKIDNLHADLSTKIDNLHADLNTVMHENFNALYKLNEQSFLALRDILQEKNMQDEYKFSRLRNVQKRFAGLRAEAVPFLKTPILTHNERSSLPSINSVEEIDRLSKKQCEQYLELYRIFSVGEGASGMKSKLREAVGLENTHDIGYAFCDFKEYGIGLN
ncbi:uncharacterized protein PRCAT00004130001 [Priceomyces carsonii]|uniref:uncharacterized protein n=1 Tax=Priceomyces carsonii TaxID=28549 RepID=UPI002EDA8299|nr:unnamed protein product [Priceomyces carsonii]